MGRRPTLAGVYSFKDVCQGLLFLLFMNQMFPHYNSGAPPQGQLQQWDAPASSELGFDQQAVIFHPHSGDSGPSTEAHEAFMMDGGHALDTRNLDGTGNLGLTNVPDLSNGANVELGSFFQTTNQFVVPGQDDGSVFQARNTEERGPLSRYAHMEGCVSQNHHSF